ncbi:ferric reductase like transmembrane component-domain-containing protein [Phaeosphaeriaceae sp. PMI808]|nr:ferric reductase like transmembrane component-domain-containing protein [Phaeosphaeriaceae sp. PMI808]
MRALNKLLPTLCLLVPCVLAEGEITGFPANPYDPYCAMFCLRSLSSLMLGCSSGGEHVGMHAMMTSTSCWASDTPYLTSLAWCMHEKCAADNIPNSKLEWFWEHETTGQQSAGVKTVKPKWSYAEALAEVKSKPTFQLRRGDTELNATALVSPETYKAQWNVLFSIQREITVENGYGIALLVTSFGTPIILTMLAYVPGVSILIRKLKPSLIWPSIIGAYHVRPLPYLLGNAPTTGQSLYIALFVFLNIIFTAVNMESRQPNAWYPTVWREIMAYVLFRTGVYAYIMAPLLFLFAGRNNVLLWLTNWSHTTFLVLHRWIARVFTLQAILHSVLAVHIYRLDGMYGAQVNMPYWIWGIVGTVSAVVLTFGSGLYVRKFSYEIFLIVHIILSVLLIVGCWYHAYDLYRFLGGYQTWLYAVSGVWFFDRIARIARIIVAGPRRAKVTNIGDNYVRIDIPGVRWGADPGKHVYVYLPTLSRFQPWENHPFSILPTRLLQAQPSRLVSDSPRRTSSGNSENGHDVEKPGARASVTTRCERASVGITLYVRRSTGITRLLHTNDSLFTLLEGPYPNNSVKSILRCDRVLLIGGGIGITALLPFAIGNHYNVKLAWSVKQSSQCLVNELHGALASIEEKEVRIGSRLDIASLLAKEAEAGWQRVGVVVSGPGGLCDVARQGVVEIAKKRKGTEWELEVEAYSW